MILNNSLTLEAVSGETFDLSSFDFSYNSGDLIPRDVGISVVTSLGQTVDSTLSLVGDFALDTYDATGQFSDIVSFTITNLSGTTMAVDNFVVTAAVPIPAAAWLFGSALAGLGWLRRKQSA